MAKIDKQIAKFVSSYRNSKGIFWKVSVPDGHGGQIRKQGFIEETDAKAFARLEYLRVLTTAKGTKPLSASKLTFEEYAKIWLESKRRENLSEASALRYEDEIKIRLNPYFGPFRMSEIEKYHLKNFIEDSSKNGVKSASLEYAVDVFKSIIKRAESDDVISVKGILQVKTPKHKSKKPVFWDQPQVRFFLNATNEHHLNDLWTIALFTGMRAGELAGLKWECVHLERFLGPHKGFIHVKRSYNQKTRSIQEHTKNGDDRYIPVLPEVHEVLVRLKDTSSGEFVFGGNEALDSSHFNRQLQSTLKELPQLPRIKFHELRHSFCSYLDSRGLNRRIVAQIMGHRDLNTTNRYSHVNERMLGDEVSQWLSVQNKQKSNNLEAVNFR